MSSTRRKTMRRKIAKRRPRTMDRDHELHVRCTGADLERWRRTASQRGLSLSHFVSYELNRAADEREERLRLRAVRAAAVAVQEHGNGGAPEVCPTLPLEPRTE